MNPGVDRGRGGGDASGTLSHRLPSPPTAAPVPVFPIACWALGLVAFAELLVAGLALAARFESSQQVRVVDREVIKVVAVPTPSRASGLPDAVVSHPPVPPVATAQDTPPRAASSLPKPTPLTAPSVADPRSEQLLLEARRARMAGDMGLAILKLEEASGRSPNDPSVHFELGLVHEVMGVYDTAADHYQKVAQLGIAGAGALYQKAMEKLEVGFVPEAQVGKMGLGRVRVYNDPAHEGGQRVILSIPIQTAPGEVVEVSDMSVVVEFFNRSTRDGIVPLEDNSMVVRQWPTEPCDWADGEETLRITYDLPGQDQANEHLFGELAYYGQVVTLIYKGEVLDMQAWPPNLAAKSSQKSAAPQQPQAPEFLDNQNLPLDFDPNLPMVLPPR